MATPHGVHFIVINADRSKKRLHRMARRFKQLGLPPFERIAGVEVDPALLNTSAYEVPRLASELPLGDYGAALAHRRAWQAVAEGSSDWAVILEDDTELLQRDVLLSFDAVPFDCDFVHLCPAMVHASEAACNRTSVRWAHWGFGMIGYLLSRDGAKRLVAGSQQGFRGPVDGHVWYRSQPCVAAENRVFHEPVIRNDRRSIRQFANGETKMYLDD